MQRYILAIDQGTTGTTALLVCRDLAISHRATVDFPQHFPKPGWVEHNPEEIWDSVRQAIAKVLSEGAVNTTQIAAIGITNQRETTLLWERASGRAVHNAIVWQCRRSAEICEELRQGGTEDLIRRRTGLVLDPYFSGTKLTWLFRQHPTLRRQAEAGDLAFGTIDSFLVWRLSGGKTHVTDPSNASRTLLMNLETLDWDPELCDLLEVPQAILPGIADSSAVYGSTSGFGLLPDGIPIAGIAGDQQAALFGQACFAEGEAKCTYGTGAFLLENTGAHIVRSGHGLLTTVAWRLNGQTSYALEGSAFIAGAAVQWLRDGLGLVRTSAEIEPLAASVVDSGGVIFVPALTGLGSPHWKSGARGLISGITRGTTAAHLARATLEGIALQIYDLASAMAKDRGSALKLLKVDGGAAENNLLLQLQADLLSLPVVRPATVETTALGAAMLAGLAVGFWSGQRELQESWQEAQRFSPQGGAWRESLLERWHEAVEKA